MNGFFHRDEAPIAGVLALLVTIMVALAALTPYVMTIPEKNLNLITQAQTTLWNGWLMILTYYFATTNTSNKAAPMRILKPAITDKLPTIRNTIAFRLTFISPTRRVAARRAHVDGDETG